MFIEQFLIPAIYSAITEQQALTALDELQRKAASPEEAKRNEYMPIEDQIHLGNLVTFNLANPTNKKSVPIKYKRHYLAMEEQEIEQRKYEAKKLVYHNFENTNDQIEVNECLQPYYNEFFEKWTVFQQRRRENQKQQQEEKLKKKQDAQKSRQKRIKKPFKMISTFAKKMNPIKFRREEDHSPALISSSNPRSSDSANEQSTNIDAIELEYDPATPMSALATQMDEDLTIYRPDSRESTSGPSRTSTPYLSRASTPGYKRANIENTELQFKKEKPQAKFFYEIACFIVKTA